METETTSEKIVAEELVPTVIAKKLDAGEPLTVEEQNTVEIVRLSSWATGDCGKPILAD